MQKQDILQHDLMQSSLPLGGLLIGPERLYIMAQFHGFQLVSAKLQFGNARALIPVLRASSRMGCWKGFSLVLADFKLPLSAFRLMDRLHA